jgi:hypothetical protein
MPIRNTILADILDRDAAAAESENLLAALADGGVYIPVNAEYSIIFMQVGDVPALPGFVSEESCGRHLPNAAGTVHCDAPRLIDIGRQTKVASMVLYSTENWAKVPIALLAQTLAQRGHRTQGAQTLKLSWSTHPMAVALRDATRERLLDFPGIQTVWIAHALWLESGNDQLMLHIEVSDDAAPDVAKRLMETLLSEDVPQTVDDPIVAMRVLNPATEAEAIREINAMGLDTVRADHATGRVEVISHEYD